VIVTCPSCSSKYRVRDEAVPPEGAELQCPTCNAHFVAQRPKSDVEQLSAALEQVTRTRDLAEARSKELEAQLANGGDAHRRLQDEAARLRSAALDAADTQRRLNDEVARLRAAAAADAEQQRRLTDEVVRLRASAGDTAELAQARAQLFDAQKKHRAAAAEVEVANSVITTLQTEVNTLRAQLANPPALAQATQRATTLQAEVNKLKERVDAAEAELARAPVSSSSPPAELAPELAGLVGAITPMLWGLEQALGYLEQFASGEPTLASHVRQLRLLQKVLTRLGEATK